MVMKLFYVHSFEKAERKTIFSCDVTCFDGSEETVHDAEGTLLKYLPFLVRHFPAVANHFMNRVLRGLLPPS